MECEELLKQISAYLDDEVALKLVKEIEKHLQECGNCTAVFNTLKQTIELYKKSNVEVPSTAHRNLYKTLNLEEFI